MEIEVTALYEEFIREITPEDMQAFEESERESEEFLRRWEAGDFTEEELAALDEEAERSELARDASFYEQFAVAAYLLLRKHARGDPWRHGLDLDEIVVRDGRVFWANPGRTRALSDQRWLNHVDGDVWHTSILKVLARIARRGHAPERLLTILEDDQPRLDRWLKNFAFNTKREAKRTREDPAGIPEGYVHDHNDPERTKEVPPPKGFRVPPPHSWRREYLAHDPWEALDLSLDVRRALAVLPPVDRDLFIRHHAYGATIRSLADGIPLGTVKSKLVSAVRKVREFLGVKENLKGSHPTRSFSRISILGGVADDLSHRHNGVGPASDAAPREEDKPWPVSVLHPDDACRQKVLRWRAEGTHGQKLVWQHLRHGSIRESWTRSKSMLEFF